MYGEASGEVMTEYRRKSLGEHCDNHITLLSVPFSDVIMAVRKATSTTVIHREFAGERTLVYVVVVNVIIPLLI